jgi:PTS system nitrogen regulatory IIA component
LHPARTKKQVLSVVSFTNIPDRNWTPAGLAITIRSMNLLDYTIETGFLPQIKCGAVQEAVSLLVDRLVEAAEVRQPEQLLAEIMRREQEGSTAIGGGLVIPHARFAGVQRVRVAVATLDEPLAIASADGQPVDVVILLVGPLGDPRQMLRVLARLARLVKQENFLDSLRSATGAAGLRAAFGRAGENGS